MNHKYAYTDSEKESRTLGISINALYEVIRLKDFSVYLYDDDGDIRFRPIEFYQFTNNPNLFTEIKAPKTTNTMSDKTEQETLQSSLQQLESIRSDTNQGVQSAISLIKEQLKKLEVKKAQGRHKGSYSYNYNGEGFGLFVKNKSCNSVGEGYPTQQTAKQGYKDRVKYYEILDAIHEANQEEKPGWVPVWGGEIESYLFCIIIGKISIDQCYAYQYQPQEHYMCSNAVAEKIRAKFSDEELGLLFKVL